MAKLYGDFNEAGPYLVIMKWNPGWFSAPHSYATDRIQMVLSGTWWVNSGADFAPKDAVPGACGRFRQAHCPHVPLRRGASGIKEPVVVAVFGIGPVKIELADPTKPSWRHA